MPKTPVSLVITAFAGASLAGVGWFVLAGWAHNRHVLLVPALLLLAGGYAIMLLAASHLQNGVSGDRWTESQLFSLRRLAESTWWNAAFIAILPGMICCLPFGLRSRSLFWALFILLQTMQQVSSAFRPSTSQDSPKPTLGLSGSSPLQSQHWGAPAQPSVQRAGRVA